MWLASSPPRYAAPSQITVTNFAAQLLDDLVPWNWKPANKI